MLPLTFRLRLQTRFEASFCGRLSARLWARLGGKREGVKPLLQYRDDPEGFAKGPLGIKLTYKQRLVLRGIRDHKSTAVAASHGAGKTFIAAVAAIWWYCTREPAIVITTAPTGHQVKNLLWRYIRTLHRNARVRLPGLVLTVGIESDNPDWYARGFAARSSLDSENGEFSQAFPMS